MAQRNSEVVKKNGLCMGILTQGAQFNSVATQTELDSYLKSAGAAHTWTLDSAGPQPKMEDYFSGGDVWIIIELKTMKVVQIKLIASDESINDILKLL